VVEKKECRMVKLVLVLILAGIIGGAIAYLGNQLGRYIGRKKLSIFRLRPRHTSILITTLTGTLIASGTLLIFYLASWEVRTLFSGLKKFQSEVVSKTLDAVDKAEVGGVVYKEREPIMMATIDGTHGKEAVMEQLGQMLALANEGTLLKGKSVAELMGTEFSPPLDRKLVGYIPEDLEKLGDFVTKNKKKYIVHIFALEYVFPGEKFAVGFYPIEYQDKVFSKGEEIISGKIDGTGNQADVNSKMGKLMIRAKGVALKKGMIANPKTYELIQAEPGLFDKAKEKIIASKKVCTVHIKAKNDVDNRGPLDVYFEVE
jgi:hypothetical protein